MNITAIKMENIAQKEIFLQAEPDCCSTVPNAEEQIGNNVNKPFREKSAKNRKMTNRSKEMRPSFNREEMLIQERLASFKGSTADLRDLPTEEKQFSNRSRLFIANLPLKTSEDELLSLFKGYGETRGLFINETKNFAFIKLDYYVNAQRAKRELQGTNLRGKEILIKFAHISGVLVKNLPPFVSNELLYHAFSVFGDIEYCYLLTDENKKVRDEGVVEFAKRNSVALAMKCCTDNCFFITSSLKPLTVTNYETVQDQEGLPESAIRKNADYYRAREVPPRFANPGSFEYQYAQRWKKLDEKYRELLAKLKSDRSYEEQKLEEEMRRAQFDYETERLREMVRQRELESNHFKQDWGRMRDMNDEQKIVDSSVLGQTDSLFAQANQLANMLDREEQQLQEQWNRAGHFSPQIRAKSNSNQQWRRESDGCDVTFKRQKRHH